MTTRIRPRLVTPLAFVLGMSALLPLAAAAQQQQETDAQRRMAAMMAERMDQTWEQAPEASTANVRILMTRDGEPFAGKVSIYTQFNFRADSREHRRQGFNPNEHGRWVYEGLSPGEWEIHVVGAERFAGFEWSRTLTVAAGDTPILEIELPAPH